MMVEDFFFVCFQRFQHRFQHECQYVLTHREVVKDENVVTLQPKCCQATMNA